MIDMKIRNITNQDFKEIVKIVMKEYGKKPYFEKWTEKECTVNL